MKLLNTTVRVLNSPFRTTVTESKRELFVVVYCIQQHKYSVIIPLPSSINSTHVSTIIQTPTIMSLASLLSSEIYMYRTSTNCHASPSIITYNQAKLLKKDLFLNKYTKCKGPRESIFGSKVLKIHTVKGAEIAYTAK